MFVDVKNEMSKSQSPTQEKSDATTQTTSQESELNIECDELNDVDDIFSNINGFVDEILNKAESEEAKSAVLEFVEAASTTALTEYSLRNQMIIFLQLKARDPEYKNNAHHFAGYVTWQNEHNRHVKNGETGYTVIAPQKGLICPECGNTPNYHTNGWIDCQRAGSDPSTWDIDPEEEWSRGVYMFQKDTTFAYQQTEPLEDAPEEDVFEPMKDKGTAEQSDDSTRAEALIETILELVEDAAFSNLDESVEAVIEDASTYTELITNGVSKDGEIHVTPQEENTKVLKTLLHEIAHEINHHKADQDLPKGVKEVEAELIAYAVCRHFGFTPPTSDLYIASWVAHANNDETQSVWEDSNTTHADDDNSDQQETARNIIKDRLEFVQSTAADIITTVETVE